MCNILEERRCLERSAEHTGTHAKQLWVNTRSRLATGNENSYCALFKAYSGERAWKPIGDKLQRPHYLSRVDHERKIRSRRQRTDRGKYSFVNRTIQHWNQLPAEVLGILPCKPITFKKRVRKVIIELN